MKAFAALFGALDETTETLRKTAAIEKYFRTAPDEDAAWALYLLAGRKVKRLCPLPVLRRAAVTASALPLWLFEECYASVGDFAETVSVLVGRPDKPLPEGGLRWWIEERCLPLREKSPEEQEAALAALWADLPPVALFLVTKVLTGSFRAGVSEGIVVRGLAAALGRPETELREALAGDWFPTPELFAALRRGETAQGVKRDAQLYPFALASPLEVAPHDLGGPDLWALEWKWDGIRAQGIRRETVHLWSRGEELVTERFPEVAAAFAHLPPGTVLDGELLVVREGRVRPFAELQTRIGRKTLSKKLLETVPVHFLAYDLLEADGDDWRGRPLRERRARLEALVLEAARPELTVSPLLSVGSWSEAELQQKSARQRSVEGLMLKRWDSPYRAGRKRGDWWKWKIDPLTMDAVLLYAQAGHGRRATLYTDYTFGVWKDEELVPIAKAYSGLTDEEILELDKWIRRHTLETFGPVRRVAQRRVFEIAFEGLQRSTRHKAGVAVRFPRILRERSDKKPSDADTIERLVALVEAQEAVSGAAAS